MADETAFTVEHNDLDRARCAGENGGGGVPRGPRHFIAERHALTRRMGECLGCGVRGDNALAERGRAACLLGKPREDA